jgi:L,D-transpeptidase ErfK/SrfK
MMSLARCSRAAVVTVALVTTALSLTGCSLLNTPWSHQAPPPAPVPVAPAAPPAPPPLPLPVDTHKFELSENGDVLGVVQMTTVGKEDTLPDIARRFNIGYEEILRSNPGVDPWLPGAGRKVVVPTQFVLPNAPREGVVINLAAMRIYYFPKHKRDEPQLVYTHPIGVGKVGWQTPEGVTKIIAREENPTWRPGAGVRKEHLENDDPVPAVVPPGPDNPLGKYKFTLGWPEYLIHGTNKPYGVGLRSSHGCIRLYPLEYFSRNLKLHPNDPECYIDRANSYFISKSWDLAIDDYSMSLDLKPANSDVWLNKGIALLNSGKVEDACHDFRISFRQGNKRVADYISRNCIK